MTGECCHIESRHVRALVYPTAALFAEAQFRLPSGRWVEPFAKAPWSDEPEPGIPGHLRRLGGEFFCLPFGGGASASEPAHGWERLADGAVNIPMHGPAANADWEIVAATRDSITLALDFPEDDPVRRVERRITLMADEPRVEVRIDIEARRIARVPAAFHPILRLPDSPGDLEIEAGFEFGLTYPAVMEPNCMASKPGQQFSMLNDVPARRGGRIALDRLPLGPPTEDVVLMAGIRKPVQAWFRNEGFAIEIDWSRQLLPHCMMWIHDRGADTKPWGGRFRGVGIEPLAAAFDGPWDLSAGSNPLSAMGYATALCLDPASPTLLFCSMAVGAV